MVGVKEASRIVDGVRLETYSEKISILDAAGRVLSEKITSDRDLPPFDRVMMDGIAISYERWEEGQRRFEIEGLQKAGDPAKTLKETRNCIEVMTGSMLPENTDTIVRYEDIEIGDENGRQIALLKKGPGAKGQNVHKKGTNYKEGAPLIDRGVLVGPAEIAIAATAGRSRLKVVSPHRIAVISTGDELVEIDEKPMQYQIRRSNAYMLASSLAGLGIRSELFHLADDRVLIMEKMDSILDNFNVVLLSGGVSKGKLDYIPEVLEEKGVKKLFYKVRQRPGKPFWFGRSEHTVVFALPGNPVSTFVCYCRYVEPWIKRNMGFRNVGPLKAKLTTSLSFDKKLTYFVQVKVTAGSGGELEATPIKGKGSSDLVNLGRVDGFLELPEEIDRFEVGESYPLFLFRSIC